MDNRSQFFVSMIGVAILLLLFLLPNQVDVCNSQIPENIVLNIDLISESNTSQTLIIPNEWFTNGQHIKINIRAAETMNVKEIKLWI